MSFLLTSVLIASHTMFSPVSVPSATLTENTPAWTDTSPSYEWGDDLTVALTKAEKDELPVLLLFTGSDWCSPCKVLESTVTDTEEFLSHAGDHVHLVRIDLPQSPNIISAERMAINKDLAKRYAINGYPTLLFVNTDGRAISKYEGPRETASLLAECEVMQHRSKYISTLLAAAEQRTGAARAALLQEAVTSVGDRSILIREYAMEVSEAGGLPERMASLPNSGLSEEEQIQTFFQTVMQMDDGEANEALRNKLNEDIGHQFRYAVTQTLLSNLYAATEFEEMQDVITNAADHGMIFEKGTYVGDLVGQVETARQGGEDGVAFLRAQIQTDNDFYQTCDEINTISDPQKRLDLLMSYDDRPLNAVNDQWRHIQIGYTFEMLNDDDKAIEHFVKARDYPDANHPANSRYAQEQIDRIDGGSQD